MITSWPDLILSLCSLPVIAMTAYLAVLALLARRRPAPTPPPARLKFDVVVPAHNEETGIQSTVSSLLALDYPHALFRVLVVADNCTDGTAERAREARAQVLVRHDDVRRGKGHALAHAFEKSLADGFADAVAVVDADSVVSPNLLSAFSAHLAAGAHAVQAEYGVRNPQASWRTRLMTIALALFHGVRSLARERLGLSCGLRGNGMGFTHVAMRQVPHEAFSIVEDVEYGCRLGFAGYRVQYVPEARVLGEMAVSEHASRSQRWRWEVGRLRIARRYLWRLLSCGIKERDPVLLDLALDLLVVPLSYLALATGLGTVMSLLLHRPGQPLEMALLLWAGSAVCLLLYVGRGLQFSRTGARGIFDLLWAPIYVVWKLTLWFRPRGHHKTEWVRTPREDGA
jgi:cellulose synthase/poly-beta-1,6-N-acetylglucosamine synthase-like glycosyltransferase